MALTASLLAGGAFLHAGPLDPPAGAVNSTYKTLGEVEPRIAINAANTPTGFNATYVISSSGSYYLTGNVVGTTGMVGIAIMASGVTVDLMGFEVRGGGVGAEGIRAGAAVRSVYLKNGTVSGWSGNGINLTAASNSIVENVRVSSNGTNGIFLGSPGVNGTIKDCVALQNGAAGITLSGGGVISGCAARENGLNGIGAGDGSTVTACTSVDNGGSGFSIGHASTVSECTSYSNGTYGISVVDGVTVTNCNSNTNVLDGIVARAYCAIRNNNCDGNGTSGNGAGIHVTGLRNRLEGNSCTRNSRGIDVDVGGNMITRNTCSSNTLNWDVVQFNGCLVVQAVGSTAISGDAGGIGWGSADPNANYTH